MLNTLIVSDNYNLIQEIKELEIWNGKYGFNITSVANTGIQALKLLRSASYSLVITEIRLYGIDGIALLRTAKSENLCDNIVLLSEFPDFHYARQGIILGAFDYLVKPFDKFSFVNIFNRMQNKKPQNADEYYENKLNEIFGMPSAESVVNCFKSLIDEVYANNTDDIIHTDYIAKNLYEKTINNFYKTYPWLDLYINKNCFISLDSINDNDPKTYQRHYFTKINSLYKVITDLYIKSDNPALEEIVAYILNNPEQNLHQKELAKQFYINNTYLSTVFAAIYKTYFADYVTNVKMFRAKYLLENTDYKISYISERLGYKDVSYFTKLFKKSCGKTPGNYRNNQTTLYYI